MDNDCDVLVLLVDSVQKLFRRVQRNQTAELRPGNGHRQRGQRGEGGGEQTDREVSVERRMKDGYSQLAGT